MGWRALVSAFKTVLLGFTVLFLFQNCGNTGHLDMQDGPGNGGGYEGLQTGEPGASGPALSVVRYVFDGHCTVAGPESVIVYDGRTYQLTIDACRAVDPALTLDETEVTHPSGTSIEYDGRTFEAR